MTRLRITRARLRELAVQRMETLLSIAVAKASTDLKIAKKQAMMARKISQRYRVRIPREKRFLFCRGCKGFIVPGVNSRVRIRNKLLVVTCLECGKIGRRVLRS